MPLHAETPETIACQLEAFHKKFGRDPCPDDPIFFDPDANEPVPLNPQQYEQAMIVPPCPLQQTRGVQVLVGL